MSKEELFDDDLEIKENATLERIIFHIVSPDIKTPKILMEVDDPENFSDFFIARLRETLKGTAYKFKNESWVRDQVTQALVSPHAFIDVSERLATKFQELYESDKRLAPGALMLLQIKSGTHKYGAIIKYDDMSVISYETKELQNGKTKPTLSQLLNNFVQDKKAIQKSVIINTENPESKIICIDRSGSNGDITDKFRDYLQAQRLFSSEMLTERLLAALIETGKAHSELLPPDIKKKLTTQAKQAVKSTVTFDPENQEKILTAAFGEGHAHEEVKKSFEHALKKRKILNEKFTINETTIKTTPTKVKQTYEGIRVIYKKEHEDNKLISFSEEGGRKVIRIITDDYVLEDDLNE